MDQCILQLFAGHETTGRSLAHLLQAMSRHPDMWQRVVDEQAALVAEHGPEITGAVLDQMVYGDAVIKEILRSQPVVDGVWRKAKEPLEVLGRRIPEGWTMQLMLARTGMTVPEWLGDRHSFNPDRWLEPAPAASGCPLHRIKDPKGYMPFGEGPRVCLGMRLARAEMRTLLAYLARHYDWACVNPEERWVYQNDDLEPENGLQARFRRVR